MKSIIVPTLLVVIISLAAGAIRKEKRSVSWCKLANLNWDHESQSAQCTSEEENIHEPCLTRDNWPEQTVAEVRCNTFWRSHSNVDSKVTIICLNGKWEEEPQDKNLKCEVICGIAGESAFDSLHVRSRSEHANQRKRTPLLKGNWPWHVGIYTEDIPGSGDFRYSCGGTLISTRAVLTAAQCVTYRQQPSLELQPSMVKIATGSFKLLYGERINETIEPVEKIVLNPMYNYTVYGADLAVIWLHDHLSISPYVHPICLPRADQDEEEIKLNELGKLVVLQNRTFEETHLPTMDLRKCRDSSTTHSLLAHSTSFCTRSNNDPAVCTHTAGVGLAFESTNPNPNPLASDSESDWSKPNLITTIWTIQGVRTGVLNLNQDCSKPIIFTKVSNFIQWINNELKNREPPIFPKNIAAAATSTTSRTSTVTEQSTPTTANNTTFRSTHVQNPVQNPSLSKQTKLTYIDDDGDIQPISSTQRSKLSNPNNNDNTRKTTTTPNPSPVYILENDSREGSVWVSSTSKKPIQTSPASVAPKVAETNEQNLQHVNGLMINGNNNHLKHRNGNHQRPQNQESSTVSISRTSAPARATEASVSKSTSITSQFSSEESPSPSASKKGSDHKGGTELHATQLEDWEKNGGSGEISNSRPSSTTKRPVQEVVASSKKSMLSASPGVGNHRDREHIESLVAPSLNKKQNPEPIAVPKTVPVRKQGQQEITGKEMQQQHQSSDSGLRNRQGSSHTTSTGIPETFQSHSSSSNLEDINWPNKEKTGTETMAVKDPVKPGLCPSIRASEGVQLQCRHERFEDTEKDNCEAGGWPGSKATYTCEKFYKSVYGTISVQQNCTERGSWFPTRDFGCKIECGISSRPKISYIVNGVISDRVSWPWHATVFKRNAGTKRLEYHCGGTLISKTVVITAAHCVTYPRTVDTIKEEFVVLLAAISSNFTLNRFDTHTRKFRVRKIYVPDTYNPLTFESDIALIQFEEEVKLTDYTKPICWPSKNNIEYSNLESVHLEHGSRGYTVGFGIDESGELGNELKETALPYVTHKDCRAALDRLPTSTQFCAGYRNGTGTSVCNGDSGGGIYFLDDSNTAKRFVLQGIISNGDPKENSQFCNSNNYAVFTKVSSFSSWIEPILDLINEEMRYTQIDMESA